MPEPVDPWEEVEFEDEEEASLAAEDCEVFWAWDNWFAEAAEVAPESEADDAVF